MTHILFVHKVFPYSGAEQVTIDIANYLSSQGYVVTVMTPEHCKDRYPKNTECLFNVVEMPRCNLKASFKAARFIRDYIVQNNVSVLVSYRELLYMPWLKRKTGVRFIYVLHNMVGYEFVGNSGVGRAFNTWFYKSKYQRIFNQCDIYGVLCPEYRKEVADMVGVSCEDHKIRVLPNHIESNPAPVLEKEKICIYVGRLTRRDKHVERLLRIWKTFTSEVNDWQLLIVGSGRDECNLKAMAEEMELKNVSFEGFQTNVQQYYDRASVLCMTSSFEGWPMSIGEAQANGVVPVLFTSFAGAHNLICNENEGVLVTPFDEDEFARKLTDLCRNDDRLKRMRDAVIAKAETYNMQHTGKAWTDMLSTL